MITVKSVKANFKPLKQLMGKIERQVGEVIVVRALNRAMTTVRKEANLEARKVINLPARGSSKGGAGLTKPGIDSLLRNDTATKSKMSVSLWAQSKAISLIHFVTGSKEPEDQYGKRVGKRRGISIMVTPGNRVRLPHSFIANANGATQLFARKGTKSLPLYKRVVKGLFGFLDKKEIRDRLQKIGTDRFLETTKQDIRYFLSKQGGKLND